MERIVKGDSVRVICGRYRGSVGKVLRVFPKENRVLVEGVNKVRRTSRKEGESHTEKEAPIHLSNVALVDSKGERTIRVAFKMAQGKKIRVDRKTGKEIANGRA